MHDALGWFAAQSLEGWILFAGAAYLGLKVAFVRLILRSPRKGWRSRVRGWYWRYVSGPRIDDGSRQTAALESIASRLEFGSITVRKRDW